MAKDAAPGDAAAGSGWIFNGCYAQIGRARGASHLLRLTFFSLIFWRANVGFDFCPKLLLAVVLCGLVACDRQTEQRTVDLTVPVTVQSVETGTIESIVTATGTLRPVREAQIATEIRGSLYWGKGDNNRLLVKGSAVKKGQVIATLDSDEWVVGRAGGGAQIGGRNGHADAQRTGNPL